MVDTENEFTPWKFNPVHESIKMFLVMKESWFDVRIKKIWITAPRLAGSITAIVYVLTAKTSS